MQLAGSVKQGTPEVLIQDLNELWWDIGLRQDDLKVLLIYHTGENFRKESGKKFLVMSKVTYHNGTSKI